MRCQRCGKERPGGRTYEFRYGRKGQRSSRFEPGVRVDETPIQIAGTAGAWICDRCVSRRRWLRVVGLLWPLGFIGGMCLVGVRVGEIDLATGVCWTVVVIGFVAWGFSYGAADRQAIGEELAIGVRKRELKAQGYDALFTTRAYKRLH